MSRQFQMNKVHTKSKTQYFVNNSNSDSSLELTELQAQNSQLQIDNINKTAALSQMTKENSEIKKKYEELLNALSNHQNNSSNTYSSPDPTVNTANSTNFFANMTQSFLPDEKAEREVQLWTEMWTHIISMITSIVPYSNTNPKSGNERRAILIDLISKLCQLVSVPSNDKYNQIKQKYMKSKEEIKYLREQQYKMTDEINKYKQLLDQKGKAEAENDEAVLTQKIKALERLIHKLIEKQRYLQENSINYNLKQSTANSLLNSNKEQTQVYRQQQQRKEQQPQIQHRVIQFNDSDEASSSNASEENDSDDNSNIQLSSKANKNVTQSFSKEKKSFSINNNNNINSGNRFINNNNNSNRFNNNNTYVNRTSSDKRKLEQSISKKFGIDEISGISSSDQINVISKRKVNKKNINLISNEDSSEINHSDDHDPYENNNRLLLSAEAEADEILAKSRNKRKKNNHTESNFEYEYRQKIKRKTQNESSRSKSKNKKRSRNNSENGKDLRKSYGNHLNQLVDLTNHLTDDYHKLGKYLGSESITTELSIDHLSKLHDSLLSVEKQLDNLSE